MKSNLDSHLKKRISYVLPTKNRAVPFLDNILNILKEIVKSDDELIIIDGMSNDNTNQVINQFMDIINVYISEPDISIFHAYNKGILLSSGRYIKFIHDDDIYYSKAMDDSVIVMDENIDIDILICGGTKERNGKTWNMYIPPGVEFCNTVEDLYSFSSSVQGALIRHESLTKIGLFDSTLKVAGDSEFMSRAVHMGTTVKFCRINSYHHPVYDHSTTIVHEELFNKTIAKIKKMYIREKRIEKSYMERIGQKIVNNIPKSIKYLIKSIYSPTIDGKTHKVHNIQEREEPIWDGGISD
jgi:glycosyltransferase involved in cell wall biosynthesis